MSGPTVGSLFAGIGGFDLGLERAGFEIRWQVEIEPFAVRVLTKHWPHIPKYGDIRLIDWSTVEPVDVLCGGFPCQDLSFAGKRAGIEGDRSGLWSEYVRCIRALRPRFVIVENVPGLLTNRYMGRVLGDLAESGYDAEWDCIPASAIGAPHRRDRVWIVAYPNSNGRHAISILEGRLSAPNSPRLWQHFRAATNRVWLTDYCLLSGDVDGVSSRVDRLKATGNAVVPQIVEFIGRQILERTTWDKN